MAVRFRVPRRGALAALLALALSTPSLARPDDPAAAADAQDGPRHDVTVTATRLETPRKEVASSLTVLTAADLARTGAVTVLEALRSVAGTTVVQNGGLGAAAALLLRGGNAEHTLVLVDGVEANDPINPSRSFDLAHLPLSGVERIEVLRGPQGPLYGSDALAGVVNVITRRGDGPRRLDLAASAGSFGTWTAAFGLSGASGRRRYAVDVSAVTSRGISAASARRPGNSEPDGYRNLAVTARGGLPLGPSLDLDLSVRGLAARTEIDAFGGAHGDDDNSRQDYATAGVRAALRGLFAGGRWEPRWTLSATASRRGLTNPEDADDMGFSEDGLYRSLLVRADWQNNLFLGPSHTLTIGAEAAGERGGSRYESRSAPFPPYLSEFPARSATTVAAYVQHQARFGGRLFVTAGARLDRHSRTGASLTWRLAPAWLVPATGTRLRATVGTAFKSPSLYQLFAPGTAWGPVGNPRLEPEASTGWDAGVDQELGGGRWTLSAGAFGNEFRNLVDFDPVAGYVNVRRARTRGWEAAVRGEPAAGVRVSAEYTRTDAVDRATGLALARRPRDRFTAAVSASASSRVLVSADVAVVGPRADRDYSTYPDRRVTLAGYALAGAVVSWRTRPGFEVFLRVENAFDARYETVWGYGTPGRSLAAGFRWSR